jgi:hypothetical protein
MAASPAGAGTLPPQAEASPVPPTPTPAPAPPPAREQPSPAAIAQAVAASAAAAQAAVPLAPAPSAPWAPAAPVQSQRDTLAVDGPAAPPNDGGIGGLFANADPEPQPSAGPPRTSVFPASPSAAPPAPAQPAGQPFSYWTEQSLAGAGEDEESGRGSGRRAALMVLAGVLVVVVLVVGGWLVLHRAPGGSGTGTAAGSTSAGATVGGPAVGSVQTIAGVDFTAQAVDVQNTCAGHAYGDTAAFFAATDCTGLSRALYSAEVGGKPVVVAIRRVRMPDAASARDLRALTDRNGSGNVNDLLREGVRYTGSPSALSGAEYASAVSGTTVTIVETAWVDQGAKGSSDDIDKLADQGLGLAVPPFPAK